MNRSLDRPLILVTAPAGYGKSVLVSAWLNTCELPNAWLSLDETIGDLGVFLTYFVTAIQTVFPTALQRTQTLLTGLTRPPFRVLAGSLINELDEVERDFIMVLEDYHSIHEPEIHNLVTFLMQPPTKRMHLVLITRKDPPLPKSALLARSHMSEIRFADLRFSADETATFMQNALGSRLPDAVIAELAEATEGWIASLRLAALAVRYSPDINSTIADLRALERNHDLTDYLMSEVLAQTDPGIVQFLLRTAILDRMCTPLCEALFGPDDLEARDKGRLEWLEKNHLFTVPLDNESHWYRYHHLFRSFLQRQLEQRHAAGEVVLLHTRASAWFARQGLFEEALHHALLGHDIPAAVRLMAEHRHALMDSEQWQVHERTFRMFSDQTVAAYPDLMLMAAWHARLGGTDEAHILDLVDRAESLVTRMPDQPAHAVHLQGEIDTLARDGGLPRGYGSRKRNHARRTRARNHAAHMVLRALHGLALLGRRLPDGRQARSGLCRPDQRPARGCDSERRCQRAGGRRTLLRRMDSGRFARDAGGNCSLACRGRNTPPYRNTGLGARFGQQSRLPAQRSGHGRGPRAGCGGNALYRQTKYLFAGCLYLCVDLPGARLARPGASEGRSDHLLPEETRSYGLLPLVEAFQAELAVRRGDLGATCHWATIGPHMPLTALPYFYAPQLALPKILLAQDTPASRDQAAEVLSRLHAFVTSIHNTRYTIEVLALEALCCHALGNKQRALAVLEQAVTLAQPGGFLRVFVDLGPALADLLGRLAAKGVARHYVEQILHVFHAEPLDPQPQPVNLPVDPMGMSEPLTRRELQVLEMLAQRLTADEIAEKLVLSTQTVKSYRANIYQKLGAHDRREAVVAAVALGILPTSS